MRGIPCVCVYNEYLTQEGIELVRIAWMMRRSASDLCVCVMR